MFSTDDWEQAHKSAENVITAKGLNGGGGTDDELLNYGKWRYFQIIPSSEKIHLFTDNRSTFRVCIIHMSSTKKELEKKMVLIIERTEF